MWVCTALAEVGLGTMRETFNAASRWKKAFTSLLSSVCCVTVGAADFTPGLFLRLRGAYGLSLWLILAVAAD